MDRKLVISIEETDDYGYVVCFTTYRDSAVFTNKYVYKFDMVKHPANAVEIEGVIYSTGVEMIRGIAERVKKTISGFNWLERGTVMCGDDMLKEKKR